MIKTKQHKSLFILMTVVVILFPILLFQKDILNKERQHKGETSFNTKTECTETKSYYWKFWRNIVSDYYEGLLFVDVISADRYMYGYKIDIIALHNKIVRLELSAVDPTPFHDLYCNYHQRKQLSFCNKKLYWLLKQEFNHEFYAPLNESELFNDRIVYGDNCGLAPIDPPERIKIDRFVHKQSRDSLLKWLQSTNTEKQMYAVDGLLQLKQKGIALNSLELKLIQKILSKKGTIYTCFGCIYNSDKIERIKESFKNID